LFDFFLPGIGLQMISTGSFICLTDCSYLQVIIFLINVFLL